MLLDLLMWSFEWPCASALDETGGGGGVAYLRMTMGGFMGDKEERGWSSRGKGCPFQVCRRQVGRYFCKSRAIRKRSSTTATSLNKGRFFVQAQFSSFGLTNEESTILTAHIYFEVSASIRASGSQNHSFPVPRVQCVTMMSNFLGDIKRKNGTPRSNEHTYARGVSSGFLLQRQSRDMFLF